MALAVLVVAALAAFPPLSAGRARAASAGAPDTPRVVSRIATDDKVVALTFDAGSDAGHTLAILDILEDEGVKATFFLTGKWLDSYPELGAAIAGRGHALGNHTRSHPHLTQLTDDEIRDELAVTERKAKEACGRSLGPFFRPPYGEHDERTDRIAAEAGYGYIIMWTIDSLDWKMIPADELVRRVVGNVEPGAIVLMHVGSQTNEPDALPRIIRELKDKGYRFATLAELLGTEVPEDVTYYTVSAGDTLSSIARRFGVKVSDILAVNALDDPNNIEAGTTLVIPSPGAGGGDGTGGGDGGGGSGGEGPTGAGGSGDQGGYGSDDGGAGGGGLGFLARLWTGLVRLWRGLCSLLGRLF